MRNGDEPARHPLQASGSLHLDGGNSNAFMYVAVPAGTRLVIESASTQIQIPTGESPVIRIGAQRPPIQVAGTLALGAADVFLQPAKVGPFDASQDLRQGTQLVRAYAAAGAQGFNISFARYRGSSDGSFSSIADATVSITGDLIDL